jgi:hypothetical protein
VGWHDAGFSAEQTMSWMRRLFARRRIYGELSQEIREHLDEKIEELVAAGMSSKEAEAAARRRFGNVGLVEEDGRTVWRWVHFTIPAGWSR